MSTYSGAEVQDLVRPRGGCVRGHRGPRVSGDPGGTLTADGVGAAGALLGVQVTEAAQAVSELVPGREALPRQRLLAGRAHEALPVPGLLPVGDASRGDGLQEAGGRGLAPEAARNVKSRELLVSAKSHPETASPA